MNNALTLARQLLDTRDRITKLGQCVLSEELAEAVIAEAHVAESGEPVAWVAIDEDFMIFENPAGRSFEHEFVPVFKHPSRSLSDDEIMEAWTDITAWKESCGDIPDIAQNFARAIEAKLKE